MNIRRLSVLCVMLYSFQTKVSTLNTLWSNADLVMYLYAAGRIHTCVHMVTTAFLVSDPFYQFHKVWIVCLLAWWTRSRPLLRDFVALSSDYIWWQEYRTKGLKTANKRQKILAMVTLLRFDEMTFRNKQVWNWLIWTTGPNVAAPTAFMFCFPGWILR